MQLAAQSITVVSMNPAGTPPAARSSHVAVIDVPTHQMIVFGGRNATTIFNDLWSLNTVGDGQWTQLSPSGTIPPARYGASAGYDAASSRMILFGGKLATGYSSEVWILAGANGKNGSPLWTQLLTSGTPPAPRAYHTGVYDASSNRLIVFGGEQNSTVFNDLWVLTNANGLSGTPVWMQVAAMGTPPAARTQQIGFYDPGTNSLLVFDGLDASGTALSEVWELSGANDVGSVPVWTQVPTPVRPTPRAGLSGILLSGWNQSILYGGYNGYGVNQTMSWCGGGWILQQFVTGGDPLIPRYLSTAVHDPASQRMIVFGGSDYTNYGNGIIAFYIPQTQLLALQDSYNDVGVWFYCYCGEFPRTPLIGTALPGWTLMAAGDMNGDGINDLIFQNNATNEVSIWFLSGEAETVIDKTPVIYPALPNWKVVAAADMNGDSVTDLILQNAVTSEVSIWFMQPGGLSFSFAPVIFTALPGWRVAAAGDVNNDGVNDLILQNQNTNEISVWYMQKGGLSFSSAPIVATAPPGWRLVGAMQQMGGMNSSSPELILQNPGTRMLSMWGPSAPGSVDYLQGYLGTIPAPGYSVRGAN